MMRKVDAALFDAMAACDLQQISALVSTGANVNAVNVYNESVLHYATMICTTEVVDLLTELGATDDVNTLLIGAAVGQNGVLAKRYLESGGDPNHKEETGTTALMYSAVHGSADVTKLLIAYGSGVNSGGDI